MDSPRKELAQAQLKGGKARRQEVTLGGSYRSQAGVRQLLQSPVKSRKAGEGTGGTAWDAPGLPAWHP